MFQARNFRFMILRFTTRQPSKLYFWAKFSIKDIFENFKRKKNLFSLFELFNFYPGFISHTVKIQWKQTSGIRKQEKLVKFSEFFTNSTMSLFKTTGMCSNTIWFLERCKTNFFHSNPNKLGFLGWNTTYQFSNIILVY